MRKNKEEITPLEALKIKSEGAVGAMRLLINELKAANHEIDVECGVNDSIIDELRATNTSLSGLKDDNLKIISNFEALLN